MPLLSTEGAVPLHAKDLGQRGVDFSFHRRAHSRKGRSAATHVLAVLYYAAIYLGIDDDVFAAMAYTREKGVEAFIFGGPRSRGCLSDLYNLVNGRMVGVVFSQFLRRAVRVAV